MRHTFQSPLQPCVVPDSGQLSAYEAIGLVTDLAINHSQYSDLTVQQLLVRTEEMLESGCAKVFFDQEQRPLGFASWYLLPTEEHCHQLKHSTSKMVRDDARCPVENTEYLWFHALLSPFTSPLFMLTTLKRELSSYKAAYMLQDMGIRTVQIRRIW